MDVKFTDNSEKVIEEVKRKIESALQAVGSKAVDYAKANCPVDTGRLRDSIEYRNESGQLSVGTDVEYGKYVELGSHGNHKSSHFLLNAMQNHAVEYRSIIESTMKN